MLFPKLDKALRITRDHLENFYINFQFEYMNFLAVWW